MEIVDDHSMSTLRVHQGCVLNMFSKRYSIDLVMIPMRGKKFIVGMLGPNGAMIDCAH